MKDFLNKVKNKVKSKSLLVTTALSTMALSAAACAEEVVVEDPSLEINFDTAQMFTWAQTLIDAMMPVVYIMMGVGLAFIVINALKRAFA